jgi:hypothetical protein
MKISTNRYISLSLITVILAAVLISCGTNPSTQTSTARMFQDGFEARRSAYMSFLRQEGYEPSIDPDGDIQFVEQSGETFYIIIDRDDPSFLSLIALASWVVYSDEDWEQLLVAISNANRTTYVGKAYLIREDGNTIYMYLASELFLENPNDIRVVFPLMIDAVNDVWDSLLSSQN